MSVRFYNKSIELLKASGVGGAHGVSGDAMTPLIGARKPVPVLAYLEQVPTRKIDRSDHRGVDLKALLTDVSDSIAELRHPEQSAADGLAACLYGMTEQTVSSLIILHDVGGATVGDLPISGFLMDRPGQVQPGPKRLEALAAAVAESVALRIGEGVREPVDAALQLTEFSWVSSVKSEKGAGFGLAKVKQRFAS